MRIQHAASQGHYELAKFLLSRGATATELPELAQVRPSGRWLLCRMFDQVLISAIPSVSVRIFVLQVAFVR